MTVSYPIYDVRTGRRLTVGPSTGAWGDTYGSMIWTGAEFHFLLSYIKNKMGFHVYANSHFGGINLRAHSPKSWHYVKDAQGRSLGADIGTYGDVNERSRIINELIPLLDRLGVGWHYARNGGVPGHYDHIHIDVSNWGRRGGSAGTGYGYYSTRKKQNIYTALGGSSYSTQTGTRDLNAGFSSTHIKWVQSQLKSLGYYRDSIDGKRGPNTQKAIKAFQSKARLKADGLPGAATESALRKAVAAKNAVKKRKPRSVVVNHGDKGEVVKVVQRIVGAKQDGSFGPATVEAVKKAQRSWGITADGSFGPGTTRTYFKRMGVRGPGSKGWAVKLLQYIAGVSMDGSYGPATTAAVKEMQAWAGITQDGYFGPKTQSKCII